MSIKIPGFLFLIIAGCAPMAGMPLALGHDAHPWRANAVEELQAATQVLRVGMTPEEVRKAIGAPDDTSQSTCGQDLGKPWPCLQWHYRSTGHAALTLRFQYEPALSLNSWDL